MSESDFIRNILIYVPLSIIGLWRWTYWVVRRMGASLYRPDIPSSLPEGDRLPKVSVVTPVYNEDPKIFKAAVDSWIKNGVSEIIAVIDKSNTRHIIGFERDYAKYKDPNKTVCRMLVTPKPGKRAALCDGLEAAKGDIIALVDSDTIWDDSVLKETLPHFANPEIGGTTVRQRILNPDSIGNVLFDILLWTRYKEEVPFLLSMGKTVNTLSGRTAFYRREAIFNDSYDNIHDLKHEFFLRTRGISGDDKRLTHLIVEQGWHTGYVSGATVYTPGLGSLRQFLKQRLRWTRNSWRADLRAVGRGWVWAHPVLALFMIDRFFAPFFMLIGPVVFVFSLVHGELLLAGILLAWWFFSRFVKIFGYFRQNPKRIIYLPAYIAYGYVGAVIKIYAFATLVEHSWATRWHKHRAKHKNILRKSFTVASGILMIVAFFGLVGYMVSSIRQQLALNVPTHSPVDRTAFAAVLANMPLKQQDPPRPSRFVSPTSIKSYVVQPGDTFQSLAQRFGMEITELKRMNGIQDADKISAGQVLLYLDGGL